MKTTLYSITALVLICIVAEQGLSLSPPIAVPDYISEMPSLKHCNEIPNNVGGFSVSRVQCGCNDNEEKRGQKLGQVKAGDFTVQQKKAHSRFEGSASLARVTCVGS